MSAKATGPHSRLTDNDMKVLWIIATSGGIKFGTRKKDGTKDAILTGLLLETKLATKTLSHCLKTLMGDNLVRRDLDRRYRADMVVAEQTLYLNDLRRSLYSLKPIPVPASTLFVDSTVVGSELAFEPISQVPKVPKSSEESLWMYAFARRVSDLILSLTYLWELHIFKTFDDDERRIFSEYHNALVEYQQEGTGLGRSRAELLRKGAKRLNESELADLRGVLDGIVFETVHSLDEVESQIRASQATGRRSSPDRRKMDRLRRILRDKRKRAIYEKILALPKAVLVVPLSGFQGYREILEQIHETRPSKKGLREVPPDQVFRLMAETFRPPTSDKTQSRSD